MPIQKKNKREDTKSQSLYLRAYMFIAFVFTYKAFNELIVAMGSSDLKT